MRRFRWLFVLFLALPLAADTGADYGRGTVGLGYLLSRLQSTARVLHTGAHPDDEDSALLAALARGQGARVAYLSLNRGEGGQNGIGPELYDALGIVRTEELLAARRIDGAEQYFTTAFDFGFSKTAAETLRFWGEAPTLAEIVARIRAFRPQVIVSRFAGNPGDGHGHHQVAGLLTLRAFRAAADPKQFPEQLAAGLTPWQASKLYVDRWDDQPGPATVDAGEWLPLYGRSALSLAMEGRSQHRSQDMGRVEPLGPFPIRPRLVDRVDGVPDSSDLFGGLDVSLPAAVPDSAAPAQHEAHARLVEALAAVRQAQSLFALNAYPRQTVVALANALRALRRAQDLAAGFGGPAAPTWRLAVNQKVDEASQALALAAGLELDALADRGEVTPGAAVIVAGQAWWHATTPVAGVRLRLLAPQGWSAAPAEAPLFDNLKPDRAEGWRVTVPADAPPTMPYWLRHPRQGDRFQVDDPALRGLPFGPPPLSVELRAEIEGAVVTLTRPVTWRTADPRHGERRQEVQVVPRVSAEARPALALLKAGDPAPQPVTVTLHNLAPTPADGTLALALGNRELCGVTVRLAAGETRRVRLDVAPPALTETTDARLAWREGGATAPLWTVQRIDYEHIRPHDDEVPAALRLVPLDVKVASRRIGYVPGPGDTLPEALAALGVPATTLTERALDDPEGLKGLQTIVVGIRAFEVNEGLRRNNARLLDWARAGGTLVVMYQKPPYAAGKFAPYPMSYIEPADRVTDETAPVRQVAAEHPLLRQPNRLTDADFARWVQERGLYFWHAWDSQYRPLLACHDPGEADQLGGLLVAPVGDGAFVYCAYALFRQLPAGVPGSYRLLANLVSYGAR